MPKGNNWGRIRGKLPSVKNKPRSDLYRAKTTHDIKPSTGRSTNILNTSRVPSFSRLDDRTTAVNLGAFYQSGYNLVACEIALRQLRIHYPDIPIMLYEDNTNMLKDIAYKYNCAYDTTDANGSNKNRLNGRPVISLYTLLRWFARLHLSCTTVLKNAEWIIIYEDDVWCNRPIIKYPRFDLSGAWDYPYYTPLQEYLLNRFHASYADRGFGGCGNLVGYQAAGGTVFHRQKFIAAYEQIHKIDWDVIETLDDRVCNWTDAGICFLMQHAGFSTGTWLDWTYYKREHTDRRKVFGPYSRKGAFTHGCKHFYSYSPNQIVSALTLQDEINMES
jgi:hypothetical protein